MGDYQEKHSKAGYISYSDLSWCFLHWQELPEIWSSFSSWHKEGDAFTNEYFSYKCESLLQKDNFNLVFRASPLSAVSLK